MKTFHISDVLSATTGRLVSNRHMDGVYAIYNHLTGDNLFTHQLSRAHRECEPWLKAQFPNLMADSESMKPFMVEMDAISNWPSDQDRWPTINEWVERVRLAAGYPEMVPVYEMAAEMHTDIDPIDEARAMVGDDRVAVISLDTQRPREVE